MPDIWRGILKYKLKNFITDIFKGVVKSAFVLFLFYRSFLIVIIVSVIYGIFNRKNEAKKRERREKEKMRTCFREVMLDMASSLTTGYSVENAWKGATANLEMLYGGQDLLCVEMKKVCARLECSIPLEQALADFAERTDVDDIVNFAEVFGTAKRTGGNLIEVTKNTARSIGERIEVKREIGAMLAGKQMEGKVMNMIPLVMIMYFWLCSPGFLNCLYTNSGHIVMTVFLVIYMMAFKWSERIGDIEV